MCAARESTAMKVKLDPSFLAHASVTAGALRRLHGFKCEVIHLARCGPSDTCYFGAKELDGDGRWVLFRCPRDVSFEQAYKALTDLPLERWNGRLAIAGDRASQINYEANP